MTEQEKAEIVGRVRERIIDGMAFTRWPPTKQTVESALEAVDFFELIEAAKYAHRVTKLIAQTGRCDEGDMLVLGGVSAQLAAALTPTDQDTPYDLR